MTANTAETTASAQPTGRLARAMRDLGQRLGVRLFDEIARQPIGSQPRREIRGTASLALAYGGAALVHLVSLALVIAAISLWMQPWHNLFVVIAALALPLMAWMLRPRVAAPPSGLIGREDFPALHALSDRTAQALGAPPVDGIAVSTELNASFESAGWAGRRYMTLGPPLMWLLQPRERAAVVAHEIAHGVNGDPLRGRFLYSAVNAAFTWSALLRPAAIGQSGREQAFGPFVSLLAIPVDLAMLATSKAVGLFAQGLLMLVYRDSQRAEYLADRLAASVAGADATRSMLQALSLSTAAEAAMHAAALDGRLAPLSTLLRDFRRDLPANEIERWERLSRSEAWRVDATHPATAMRIDMLARGPGHSGRSLLSDAEEGQLEAELTRLLPDIERELTNHCVVGLHG